MKRGDATRDVKFAHGSFSAVGLAQAVQCDHEDDDFAEKNGGQVRKPRGNPAPKSQNSTSANAEIAIRTHCKRRAVHRSSRCPKVLLCAKAPHTYAHRFFANRARENNTQTSMPKTTRSLAFAALLVGNEVAAFSMQLPTTARRSRRSGPRANTVAMSMQGRRAFGASLAAGAALASSKAAFAAEGSRWAVSEFLDVVGKDGVERVVFSADSKTSRALDADGARHSVEILPTEVPELVTQLRAKSVPFAVQAAPTGDGDALAGLAANLLFPLVLLGGLFFLGRRGGGMGGMGGMGGPGGPMGMLQPEEQDRDGAPDGCDLRRRRRLRRVQTRTRGGRRLPVEPGKVRQSGRAVSQRRDARGTAGTGKTLLARAVAGEAGVPFISCSGSEFVEMFVGVGVSHRSLFADAKKNAPCIIFIDEIDAIGRQRSSGGGFASNDEREQTLNQILTEMDGFSGNTGVIVIAATNRADILDNALLRPGRFDRRVPVDLPDKAGRVEILKVHCRDKPLAPDVDLDAIASRAIGFSGASLQNLMNEAAIVAARREKEVITFDEIDFAIDRLQVGMQKPSTQGFQNKDAARKRQELVAWHEAGHAVMAALTPGYDGVAKVTIIPAHERRRRLHAFHAVRGPHGVGPVQLQVPQEPARGGARRPRRRGVGRRDGRTSRRARRTTCSRSATSRAA